MRPILSCRVNFASGRSLGRAGFCRRARCAPGADHPNRIDPHRDSRPARGQVHDNHRGQEKRAGRARRVLRGCRSTLAVGRRERRDRSRQGRHRRDREGRRLWLARVRLCAAQGRRVRCHERKCHGVARRRRDQDQLCRPRLCPRCARWPDRAFAALCQSRSRARFAQSDRSDGVRSSFAPIPPPISEAFSPISLNSRR